MDFEDTIAVRYTTAFIRTIAQFKLRVVIFGQCPSPCAKEPGLNLHVAKSGCCFLLNLGSVRA